MNNRESRSSLSGRTALVTGGSPGVGAATSKLLAARGANVIVNYFNNKEAADKVVGEINKEARGTQGYAIAMQADVTKQTQVEYIVGEAIQRYGRIDILVGRYFLKPFLETTWDDFTEKFNDEIKQQYASLTTIGRTNKPEDVTNVIAFFASDESEYITRTYAPVDGGLVIRG